MAARFAVRAFFLGAATCAQAAVDDAVNLIQQGKLDKSSPASTTVNRTVELHRLQYQREKHLARGGTGIYCVSDYADVVGTIGCMGGGLHCSSCVNGIIACNEGYIPVIDFFGKMNCATHGRRDLCMERGCNPGGCCEQTCCPPALTAASKKEMRNVFNVSKYVGQVPHPRMPHPTKKQLGEAISYVKKPTDIIPHPRMPHPTREQMGEALSYFKTPSHTHTEIAKKPSKTPSHTHAEIAKKPSAVKSGEAPVFFKAAPSVAHPRT